MALTALGRVSDLDKVTERGKGRKGYEGGEEARRAEERSLASDRRHALTNTAECCAAPGEPGKEIVAFFLPGEHARDSEPHGTALWFPFIVLRYRNLTSPGALSCSEAEHEPEENTSSKKLKINLDLRSCKDIT